MEITLAHLDIDFNEKTTKKEGDFGRDTDTFWAENCVRERFYDQV